MSREIWKEIINKSTRSTEKLQDLVSEFYANYTVSKKGESIEVRKSKFTNQIGSHKSEYPRENVYDTIKPKYPPIPAV